jgi:hypothetical protein
MIEDEATCRLGKALNHLHAFAPGIGSDACQDDKAALTASDLAVIPCTLKKIHETATATAAPKL